jgi:hypothetical protein
MTEKKSPKTYWFLPSISDVIFVIVLAIILSGKGSLLGDADTGYHIRAGEYIIGNLKVPDHEIFSHISPPVKWTAHEWLSEVIFALIHRVSGLTGIVAAASILIASIYALLFKYLRSSGMNIIVAALVVALATGTSTIHWLARPHIFSLLFTLVWYMVLDTYQVKKKNYLYFLPPLMLLWVNLHAGFIAGFMLLAVYITGNLFKAIFVKKERQEASGRLKTLLLFSILCLLASLLNPKGYDILLFPFRLTSNKFIMDHVNEFLSPNFHADLRFEYMLLLMILVFGVSVMRLNVIETMLVLLFTHMSLFSARYIPLYAIILTPIIGKRLDDIITKKIIIKAPSPSPSPARGEGNILSTPLRGGDEGEGELSGFANDRIGNSLREKRLLKRFLAISDRAAATDSKTKGYLWSVAASVIVIFLVFTGKVEYGFDRKKLPVDAVRFMKKEKITGNMFNNDEFGDFIIYAAWPEYKVFMDGRSDMYGTERMKEYFKVIGIKNGWERVFEKYGINWVVYNADSPLTNFLLESKDWRLVYADKVANIFVKNVPEYQSLINKYPDVKPVIEKDKDSGTR